MKTSFGASRTGRSAQAGFGIITVTLLLAFGALDANAQRGGPPAHANAGGGGRDSASTPPDDSTTSSEPRYLKQGDACASGDASIMENGAAVSQEASDCIGVLLGVDNASQNNFTDDVLNSDVIDFDNKPHYITSSEGVTWTPGAFGMDGWTEEAKIEDGPAGDKLGFSITNLSEFTSGATNTLNWEVGSGYGLNGTWMVRVKQAEKAILWLFSGLSNATGGSVTLSGVGNDFSNLSLISTDQWPPEGQVPAPATWLLVAPALLLLRRGRMVTGR